MLCTGGPYGDACSSYAVILGHKYTVKEFIEEVLREKPGEWGDFIISNDLKRIHILDKCEYKYGRITENFKQGKSEEIKIKEIKAHGGWTAMDYFIQPMQI
jgi:hypothetical protein